MYTLCRQIADFLVGTKASTFNPFFLFNLTLMFFCYLPITETSCPEWTELSLDYQCQMTWSMQQIKYHKFYYNVIIIVASAWSSSSSAIKSSWDFVILFGEVVMKTKLLLSEISRTNKRTIASVNMTIIIKANKVIYFQTYTQLSARILKMQKKASERTNIATQKSFPGWDNANHKLYNYFVVFR